MFVIKLKGKFMQAVDNFGNAFTVDKKTAALIKQRNAIKRAFDRLYSDFYIHRDGIHISGIIFSSAELRRKLDELDVLISA